MANVFPPLSTQSASSINSAVVAQCFTVFQGDAAAWTVPYPGVRETLQNVSAAGLILGVVTSKPYAATMDILDALNLTKMFSAIVGGDSAAWRKPYPDPVLKVVHDAGLIVSEMIVAGDNYHDVEAAHAADR